MAASNNSKLVVSDLDFDSIKTNLLAYLQSQSQFQDYDFTGSALNQLVNLLAYNTHYLAFYLNMVANEMFIDTAVLLPNIISHAKLMGYTPRSMTAAKALVNVAITKLNTDPTTLLTIPAFTAFTSEPLNGQSFNFLTIDTVTASNVGNTFTFTGIVIAEGQAITKTFVVDSSTNPTQIFDLVDSTVDTSTLQVIVQTSNTNLSQNTFSLAENAVDVDGDSNVYYIDIGQTGNYQIYFGDGILGTQLDDGNLVIVTYISTTGSPANGLTVFQLQSPLLSGSTANVTTAVSSSGGSPAETGTSIAFSAPKSYLSQNRAVTVPDYIALINKKYPFFQSINVWGGEQSNPPVYGKVFISAVPLTGFQVTQAQQQYLIKQVLEPLSVLTVTPEYVPANENFMNFRMIVCYDPTQTTKTSNQIASIASNAAIAWANTNLNQFNSIFVLSSLLAAIDDSDPSIVGNFSSVYLQKRFIPVTNQTQTYTLTFGQIPLKVGISTNKLYSSPTFTQNDQTGTARQCYIEEVPASSTGISSIDVMNSGSGYTSTPTLIIEGDGTGANAYAVVVNGQIESVVVDISGAQYTTATVLIEGDSGSGAVLQAEIDNSVGTLRSYYFDQNNIKTVLNENVGTIDYINGIITLTNFNPISVNNPSGTLSLYVPPLSNYFTSSFNNVLVFDPTDPASITVTTYTRPSI